MTVSTTDRNILHPTEKNAVLAWTIGASDPLVPLNARIGYQEDLIDLIEAKPQVVASVFTGAISMLIRALPAEDPWLSLEVSSDYNVTTPAGDSFSVEACFDLAEPRMTDRRLQLETAPLVEDIPDASKVLLAAASQGWTATLAKAEGILPLASPSHDEADGIFQTLEGAYRWAAFRYNCYAGRSSMFHTRCIGITVPYYNAPMQHNTGVIEKIDQVDPDVKIEDGMWDAITDGDW